VRLPSHDRRLKQYERWLRAIYRHHSDIAAATSPVRSRAIKTWWVYLDDIPVSKLTDLTIEQAIPA
jgi:hypothetical protein